MLDEFICDAYGFTSSEEVGTGNTYYCPKCGNKMRRSTHSGTFGGSNSDTRGSVVLWDLMYIIFVGGLSFGIVNYITYMTPDLLDIFLFIIWFVLFVYSFISFHKMISGPVSNKSIVDN